MTDPPSPPPQASSSARRRSTTPRLVRREDKTESLAYFWVKFDGEPTPFVAGQYMTIGVMVDGQDRAAALFRRLARRASTGTDGYEFYVRLVQGGTFTPLLWELPIGQGMRMIGPKGKFMLGPDEDLTHIFISTGTGNAPFVAMMEQLLDRGASAPGRLLQRRVLRARARLPATSLEEWDLVGRLPRDLRSDRLAPERPAQRRLDGPDRAGRDDPRRRPRRAGPVGGELDRLHLRQPGHDPRPPRRPCSGAATPRSRSTRSSTGPRARSRAARRGRRTLQQRSTRRFRTRISRIPLGPTKPKRLSLMADCARRMRNVDVRET